MLEEKRTEQLKSIHNGLKNQCNQMIINAEIMQSYYGDNDKNSLSLIGAARMTQEWYEEIEKEPGIKANEEENSLRKIKINQLENRG